MQTAPLSADTHTTVLLTEAVDALLGTTREADSADSAYTTGTAGNKGGVDDPARPEAGQPPAEAPNGIYVDGTFGRGGHSRLLLRRLGARGRLLAIDRDPQAVAAAVADASFADTRF